MGSKTVVFDLDDTLTSEIDFLKSAYKEIAIKLDEKNASLYSEMLNWYFKGENVFQRLVDIYSVCLSDLLLMYRTHLPNLTCDEDTKWVLTKLKKEGYQLGIITDGRSITQRNKLKALGLIHFFNDLIISEEFGSEKMNPNNFMFFHKNKSDQYYYIGDNPKKDFINPNKLGWITICLLDKGENIHKQNFNLPRDFLPLYTIENIRELFKIITI